MVQDVVCRMEIDPAESAAEIKHDGRTYYFCSPGCAEDFRSDPASYAQAVVGGRRR